MPFFILAVIFLRSVFKSRRQLLLENLALRQQVTMLRKSVPGEFQLQAATGN
jgi:hypothetical protein